MTTNASPAKGRLTDRQGPALPDAVGSVYPEDGTQYVDAYTAQQMQDYADACVGMSLADERERGCMEGNEQ